MRLGEVYEHEGAALFQAGGRRLHSLSTADLAAVLARYCVEMVVNVAPHRDERVELYVAAYRHVPFGDNARFRPELEPVMGVVREAAAALRAGGNVLTHCFYGVNRSGLTNALIIREVEGCSGAEALAQLRTRRRGACGGNRHFVSYLEGLGRP